MANVVTMTDVETMPIDSAEPDLDLRYTLLLEIRDRYHPQAFEVRLEFGIAIQRSSDSKWWKWQMIQELGACSF